MSLTDSNQIRRKLASARAQLRVFDEDIETLRLVNRDVVLQVAGGDAKNIGGNEQLRADTYERAYRTDEKLMRLLEARNLAAEQIDGLTADLEELADDYRERRLAVMDKYADALMAVAASESLVPAAGGEMVAEMAPTV